MYLLTNSTPGAFVFFVMLTNSEGQPVIEQLSIPGNNVPIEITSAMADALRQDMIFSWYSNFGVFTLTEITPEPEPEPGTP